MNYIREINAFYDWLETNTLTDSAINLWQALMHVANKAGWPGEFAVALSTLQLKTGLKKDAIITARHKLQQTGRITFKSRSGQQSAVYSIVPFGAGSNNCVGLTDTNPDTNPDTNTVTKSTQTPTQTATINKLNEDETKRNNKNFSLEIEKFRSRYSLEQLQVIEKYLDILRTTRIAGKISDSVIQGIYKDMHRFDPIVVEYACKTIIAKPDLHAKKENYFVGILRNTTIDEAVKGLQGGRSSPNNASGKLALIDKYFGTG